MLWARVLVILCALLETTSGYYYRFSHKNRHHHVVDCGYYGCLRRGPPVCNQWCVIYVMVGFCRQARYECCSYREKSGYCPVVQNVCKWPLPYFSTKVYECQHDFNCPIGHKCCKDSCFVHRVCRPCTKTPPHPTKTTPHPTRDTEETTVKTTTVSSEQPNPGSVTTEIPQTTEESATESMTFPTKKPTTTEVTTETPTQTESTTTSYETPTETTTKATTTPARTTSSSETTAVEEVEGSGMIVFPEPEAALFGGFSDDEDFAH